MEPAHKDTEPRTSPFDAPAPTTSASDVPRGGSVDRYVILGKLGKGGMGAVYSAYDPQLDRRVALKFLRIPVGISDDLEGTQIRELRARLVREAQAMARLSHPNVVTVFDVGVADDGRVFAAMEMVEGGTLADWLGKGKRTRREIVRLLCEAGEGLAAAHAAGLIHRDFKLENVLIGKDGRPRVTDFGLARAAGVQGGESNADDAALRTAMQSSESLGTGSLSMPLTMTGALLGTPGYMAPEQYGIDEEIDARADIFAFCATLYRALYGERPFEGKTLPDVAEATLNGKVREPPKGSEVPPWIRRVLMRGLSVSPEARPRTMAELLAALRADPAVRRKRWVQVGMTVGALAAAIAGWQTQRRNEHRACEASGALIAGVWDDAARSRVRAAMVASRLPYAEENYARTATVLDRYAAAWSAMRAGACVATRVRGEQSEAMLGLRAACLDDRLREFRALEAVLEKPDVKVAEKSVAVARSLSPVQECADVDRLSGATRLPSDPKLRGEIDALREELATAKALFHASKEQQSLELLSQMQNRIESAHHGPLLVSWSMRSAAAKAETNADAAIADYEQAIVLADTYRLDAERAQAEIELARLKSEWLGRGRDAFWNTRLAGAAIERMGGDARLETWRDVVEGWIHIRLHKGADAGLAFRRAIDRAQEKHIDDADLLGSAHAGLATQLAHSGQLDAAIDEYHQAIRELEQAYGPRHTNIALYLKEAANDLLAAGRLDEALDKASRALAMLEAKAASGEISQQSAVLGGAVRRMGDVLLRMGRAAEAVDQIARGREIYRAAFGTENIRMALASTDLAEALRRTGRITEAEHVLGEATAIENRLNAIASEVPPGVIANTLTTGAKLELDKRNIAGALPFAERALTLWLEDEVGEGANVAYELADARLVLARVLKRLGKEPPRRRALAEKAREAFQKLHDVQFTQEASAVAGDAKDKGSEERGKAAKFE